MFARQTLVRKVINVQKRNGHWLHKNTSIEENAGLREATYQTWQFTLKNTFKLMVGLFIPSYFLYSMSKHEMELRDFHAGIPKREYGVMFPEGSWDGTAHYNGNPDSVKPLDPAKSKTWFNRQADPIYLNDVAYEEMKQIKANKRAQNN